MTSLQLHYNKTISPLLIERFNLKYINLLPSPKSILITISSKQTTSNQNILFNLLVLLELITQQQPSIIRAKQSIATFKLKKGTAVGSNITINKKNIWDFLYNLNLIILPKLNLNKFKLNSNSATNIGINKLNIFNQIENKKDKLKTSYGLTITLLITSKNIEQSKTLLQGLQTPLYFNTK